MLRANIAEAEKHNVGSSVPEMATAREMVDVIVREQQLVGHMVSCVEQGRTLAEMLRTISGSEAVDSKGSTKLTEASAENVVFANLDGLQKTLVEYDALGVPSVAPIRATAQTLVGTMQQEWFITGLGLYH